MKRFNLIIGLFFFLIPMMVFQSCEENEIIPESIQQYEDSDEEENFIYTDEDGNEVSIILSENHKHVLQSFKSEEAYMNALDYITNKGEVTININLYNQLKHFCDPVEISLLDEEGKYEGAGTMYQFTKEAVYTWEVDNPSSKKMSYYYGEKGDEDLKEVEFIIRNLDNPGILENYDFKNKELAKKTIEIQSLNKGAVEDVYSNTTYLNTIACGYSGVYFKARCWNQSYKVGFGKFRSQGGTQMLAGYPGKSWFYLTDHTFNLKTGGTLALPLLVTEIYGGEDTSTAASLTAWSNSKVTGRRKNHTTTSRHWIYLSGNNLASPENYIYLL